MPARTPRSATPCATSVSSTRPWRRVAPAWAEPRCWNERHAVPLAADSRPHANPPDPDRRLRIGYVSADFRRHSAAYAILPILEAHDAARVEVTCYSNSTRSDDLTERFR